MDLWNTNIHVGTFFTDFAVLSVLILCGSLLRKRIKLLNRNFIPANVIAGVLGLILTLTGLSFSLINSDRFGLYVYHLLALLFIALSLRSRKSGLRAQSLKIGLLFISTYLIQAVVGLSIAFFLIYTIYPDLFAGIGLLMPLAFGMNPGIAYSIGQSWEPFGFTHGGTTGLAFAAIGFGAAYTIGIIMVKKGIQNGASINTPIDENKHNHHYISADMKVMHWALIGSVYLLTILILSGVERLLVKLNMEQEITTLWSFHFIFAAVIAIAVRQTLDRLSLSTLLVDQELSDNGNVLMDFMVVASISAITLAVIQQYWLALLLMGTGVTAVTWVYLSKITVLLYKDKNLERKVAVFGNMTGTMQSALVLLRIVDPHHRTSVSQELVYGSGLALVLGFPLLLIINAPVLYFDNILTGFWTSLVMILLYLALVMVSIWHLRAR